MRKIERQMLDAIRARVNWKSGNTEVRVDSPYAAVHVYLHGHHIAALYAAHPEHTPGLAITWAGWVTPTTRSRLNAILHAFTPRNAEGRGYGVSIGHGKACLWSPDDVSHTVSSTDWHNLPLDTKLAGWAS